MSEEHQCTHCGAALAADAPEGLCPACLLQRGLDSQTESHDGGRRSAADYVAPTPAELAPHFPDLEILELLGQGGMGVVYKARQKSLDRLVALKILGGKVGPGPAFADRFAREARAMAMLNHPHIVTVYDFGQTDGLYYFVMEFVDGLNLRQLMDSGRLAPKEALAIVPQICEALQYAHDKGIVHRDVKPANILLDKSGRVKIADFGVAKLMDQQPADGPLTGEGHVMGTPHYMAPEQVEHPLDVDHRADIYSLGVVFYQMLTGELPIGRFAAPSKKVAIDVRLDEVVLRALEKEPELRFQHASEVKTRLETIAGTNAELPHKPEVILGLFDRWPWDSRCLAAPAILYGIFVVSFLAWLLTQPGISTFQQFLDSPRFFGFLVGLPFAICGLSYLAGRAWIGHRIRRLKSELPKSDGEVAEALIDRDFDQSLLFGRGWAGVGLAVLHSDRLELIFILERAGRLIVPLEDIAEVREVRWFFGAWLFWKQGFQLRLKNGRSLGLAVPKPFARRWRSILSHGRLPDLSAHVEGWTGIADNGAASVGAATGEIPIAVARESHDSLDDAEQPARQLVQGPAIGLLVTGVLNGLVLVSIPLLFAFKLAMVSLVSQASMTQVVPSKMFLIVPVLLLLLAGFATSGFIIVAALKMMRLEGYRTATAASILAILVSPTNLIGLAIGIWSLIVLSRADVRAAFAQRERRKKPRRPATPMERRLGLAALVLTCAAIPLSLLLGFQGSWSAVLVLFVLLSAIALVCGIFGRKSIAGKLAICFSALILFLGSALIAHLLSQLDLDFGGLPSVVRLDAETGNSQNSSFGPVIKRTPSAIDEKGKQASLAIPPQLKPIPREAAALFTAMTALPESPKYAGKLADMDYGSELQKELSARFNELCELLRGTAAEPLLEQVKAVQIESRQAKDPATALALSKKMEPLVRQLEDVLKKPAAQGNQENAELPVKITAKGDSVIVTTPDFQMNADAVELGQTAGQKTPQKAAAPSVDSKSPLEVSVLTKPRLQFRLEAKEGDRDAEQLKCDNGAIRVAKQVLLDESAVATAAEVPSPGVHRVIELRLTEAGAKKFGEITAANIGRRLAILFDGRVLVAPTIRSQINDAAQIVGQFSDAEVQAILKTFHAAQEKPPEPPAAPK